MSSTDSSVDTSTLLNDGDAKCDLSKSSGHLFDRRKTIMTPDFEYDSYVNLLSKMISQTERLQNKPPKLVPCENLIACIVESELKDCDNVSVKRVEYVEGRPNLIIRYENFPKNKSLNDPDK